MKHHKRNSPKYEEPRHDHSYQEEHTNSYKDPNQDVEVFKVPEQKYSKPFPRPQPVRFINCFLELCFIIINDQLKVIGTGCNSPYACSAALGAVCAINQFCQVTKTGFKDS